MDDKKFKDRFNTVPLDEEEREIMEDVLSSDEKPKRDEEAWVKYKSLVSRNIKKISINILKKDLEKFREISDISNIPYQTLMQSALHRYILEWEKRSKKNESILV